ncbi:MAG: peptidoglycan DD-metalloendopeptidase family protein [Pseudomonadota bacterium]
MFNQRLTWIIIFTLFFPGLTLPAEKKSSRDLSSIKKEIAAVQNEISLDEKNLNTLNSQLKTSEKNISSLTLKITQLSKKIEAQESQLTLAKEKKHAYDVKIEEQQNTLERLIAANYSLQRQGRAGIYFSGQSVDETERFLKYYQALDIAVIKHINEIRETILKLNKVMVTISSKTSQLQHSLSDYKNKVNEITKAQKNRQTAVASINSTLNTHRKVLDQLLLDRKQLSTLVTHLATSEQISHLSFSSQKGKLNWPVQGVIKYLFLEPMANDSVRWQGDLIEAKEGTPVHAIYSGKVIYADWLRGYGLLVIIDHGGHYLSLYARNDTLNHKVGDYVSTGDVIGTVGQSGGFQDPALYFEMRHNTQAINPRDWFTK